MGAILTKRTGLMVGKKAASHFLHFLRFGRTRAFGRASPAQRSELCDRPGGVVHPRDCGVAAVWPWQAPTQ